MHSFNKELARRFPLSPLRAGSLCGEATIRRIVLRDYLQDGRLKQWPGQWKKRQVIHRYLVTKFDPGRRYPEREVNQIIGEVHEDFATLRRELVDTGLLNRERDVYWRNA